MNIEAPGWYRDPGGRDGLYRWWTGTGWTQWMSSTDDADAPDLSGATTAAVLPRRHREVLKTSTTVLLALAVLIALVVVMTVAGVLANARAGDPDAGVRPTSWTPIARSEYKVVLDEATRKAQMGPVTLTVPAGWTFRRVGVEAGYRDAYVSETKIGEGYFAAILFGEPNSRVRDKTARMAGQSLLLNVLEGSYGAIDDIVGATWTDCPGQQPVRCSQWSGTVKYTVKGKTLSDELRALVYQQDNDSWFFTATMYPSDSPPAIAKAVADVWQSVHLPG